MTSHSKSFLMDIIKLQADAKKLLAHSKRIARHIKALDNGATQEDRALMEALRNVMGQVAGELLPASERYGEFLKWAQAKSQKKQAAEPVQEPAQEPQQDDIPALEFLVEEQEPQPAIDQAATRRKKSQPADAAESARIYPRFKRRLHTRYYLSGSKEGFNSFSHDIGPMGMFIISGRQEHVGTKVMVEVDLPDIGKLSLKGHVVWAKWVPPGLKTTEYSGFGLKIDEAPESWFNFFVNL